MDDLGFMEDKINELYQKRKVLITSNENGSQKSVVPQLEKVDDSREKPQKKQGAQQQQSVQGQSQSQTGQKKQVQKTANNQETHKYKKNPVVMRQIAGQLWEDNSLADWPQNDYRVFVGNLGNEVTDPVLKQAFEHFKSLAQWKVIRNKKSKKSEGYGFISLLDPNEYLKCLKEMNGQYVGNRPCKIEPSSWKDRIAPTEKYKSDELFAEYRKNSSQSKNSKHVQPLVNNRGQLSVGLPINPVLHHYQNQQRPPSSGPYNQIRQL